MTTVEQRLSQWQQELLDLTNRNRLLNYRFSPSRPSSIQLVAPSSLALYRTLVEGKSVVLAGTPVDSEGGGALPRISDHLQMDALIEEERGDVARGRLISNVSQAPAPPPDVKSGTARSISSDEVTNRVARRLLARARASEQEQGINTLFGSFGLLRWQEKPGETTWRFAPLVMLPLAIEEVARGERYRIRATGEDPEFNQTLIERLSRDFGIEIRVDLDDETPLANVFETVRAAVSKTTGWEIREEAHVGLFQFHKIRMFHDLNVHARMAARHDIIQALAIESATIAPLPEGVPNEDELDRAVPPQQAFTVLDADASQLLAIQAAVRGGHLIIQGPPGTGKSQTITNIIAESLAAGKTVLFVSEKAAALDVVHRRLVERGLGDYCLSLHSQKANKRDIIYELGARLEPEESPVTSSQEQHMLRRLGESRNQLNGYADALHRRREPLGESAYWAHGELASLGDAPYLASVPSVTGLTLAQLDDWTQILDTVARFATVLGERDTNPWVGYRKHDATFVEQQALRTTLISTREAVDELRAASQLLATELGLPVPVSMSGVWKLFQIAQTVPVNRSIAPVLLNASRTYAARALADEAVAHSAAIKELELGTLAAYSDAILEITDADAIAAYNQSALVRLFSPSYRRIRIRVKASAKDGQSRSSEDELAVLRAAQELNRHIAWFSQRAQFISDAFGLGADRATWRNTTLWTSIVDEIAVAAKISEQFGDGPPPAEFTQRLSAGLGAQFLALPARVDTAGRQLDSGLTTIRAFIEPVFARGGAETPPDAALDEIAGWLDLRVRRFDDLDPWVRTQKALDRATTAGLGAVVDQLVSNGIAPNQWGRALRRSALMHWLGNIHREDSSLGDFRGDDHNATIAQFRELDRRYIDTTVNRVRQSLSARRGRVSSVHGGEPGLLRYEAQKRKRHMPLRKLFERIPNLLPALKPCLMMSPLSVAQFLPADRYRFDVVIFDEASQVRPHDAIGAIIRGKQLIVAGDSKQLPPTAFFDRAAGDHELEEEQDLKDLESILDGLQARNMPPQDLLWHYRSRHEDLIAFSNHHIYGGRLITFPTPTSERSATQGVRLDYVADGRHIDERDNITGTPGRRNRIEARRVANLVLHHARTRPKQSLGVVALGITQRDAVDDEIKRARLLESTLDDFFRPDKPEPFFVKSLELVQGDERDVIIISIGFAKNEREVLSHNFGPINQDGGERRLNVLVTRARHLVIVVSSIRAGDIDLGKTHKRGPRLLKSYLDFAERGPIALPAETTAGSGSAESPFEVEVGEALIRAGYTVHRQVGCSGYRIDLAIVDPQRPARYLLGIECDGATYHRSKTARDRDRLRQEILEDLGWTIHRIWSTEWIRQPEKELNRVIERVKQVVEARTNATDTKDPVDSHVSHVNGPVPSDEMTLASSVQQPNGQDQQLANATSTPALMAATYRIAELSVVGFGDIYSVALGQVADAVARCVNVEGPIHRELLARRIAAAWGHGRAGSRMGAHINQAVSIAVNRKQVQRKGEFLWKADSNDVVVRGPAADGWTRAIAHIPSEEIKQGITLVLKHAFSLTENELVLQVSRLFGYQRTGAEINRRLREEIRATVNDKSIELRNGRFQLTRQVLDPP